jgi:hypothetical protein
MTSGNRTRERFINYVLERSGTAGKTVVDILLIP